MTSSRTKAQLLQIVGIIAILLTLLDDSYLHMPGPVFAAVVVGGIVCLIVSYRIWRPSKSPAIPVPMNQKHRRFALFLAAALFGGIIAWFLPASGTSHLPPTTRVLIAVGTVLFVIVLLIWKIYFPRHKHETAPDKSREPSGDRGAREVER